MKKLLSLLFVVALLVSSSLSIDEFKFSTNSPSSEKSKAIQRSNQRNERKGSKNGSLK